MAIAITVKGAQFTKYIKSELPHEELAVGYYLMGRNAAESRRNRVANSSVPEATVFGQPTYADGYVEMTTDNFLDSGIQIDMVNGDFTMISIASVATVSRQPLCGTWHSGVANAMLYRDPRLLFATRGGAQGVTPISDNTLNSTMFHAGVKRGSEATIYLKTADGMQKSIGAVHTNSPENTTYRIGPNGGTGEVVTHAQQHAANLLFNVALTEQQVNDIYEYFAYLLPTRSIELV